MKKLIVSSLVLATGSAMASSPDFSSLTSGIDFSTAVTAIMAVGVALAGLYVAIAGVRGVLRMIRG